MTITKTALLSAASALILLSTTSAHAAEDKRVPGKSEHTSFTNMQSVAQAIPRATPQATTPRVDIGKLVGADVVNAAGETLGEVDDVVTHQGKPHLILSVGKFLGIGGRQVAIDLDKAQVRPQEGATDKMQIMVSMSKEQLRALPKYDAKQAPKPGTTTN